jgi:D-alanine--poly(phosphoribitol) ligase subunit 1
MEGSIMMYDRTIMDYFEDQVEQTPFSPALIIGDEVLTYAELNRRSNQVARTLRNQGIGPNTVVGIMAERSFEMLIGIFSILKAGGAYMPVLPTNPVERIRYFLKESDAAVLLTQVSVTEDYGIPTLDLRASELYWGCAENLEHSAGPQDLAYVIYTSGSTGKPKGAMIEHHSLTNRLVWMQACYPINQNDLILQKTPFIFDVSVWELFWWCMVGARLCLLQPGYEKFPLAINACVAQNYVTVTHFVPSMLNTFLNYVNEHATTTNLASLRYVFTSGEALTPAHVKQFKRTLYRMHGTRLTNLYGPTEATVDVTYFDCPMQDELEKVPIGKPIDNIEILILDGQNECVPTGETGELCIAGVGVARGYINNPTLTAEKFVRHPFQPSTRMYKTGDLARWLPDGNIEFLGRADQQVKIRGIRIELGEIESTILEYAHIQQCVIVAEQESEDITLLIAYMVTTADFSLPELKKYLRQILPDYMFPHVYLSLPDIPLTPTGKADRKALTKMRRKKE